MGHPKSPVLVGRTLARLLVELFDVPIGKTRTTKSKAKRLTTLVARDKSKYNAALLARRQSIRIVPRWRYASMFDV